MCGIVGRLKFLCQSSFLHEVTPSITKISSQESFQKLLPAEILSRPKMGFGVPLGDWFRGELREIAHDILLSRRAQTRGYFKEQVVEQLLTEHAQGIRLWYNQLWNLLMLELWFRMFIDGEWKLNYHDF